MSGCCPSNGRYDLAVIGAGSAGFSAAITAAEEGARVALIGHGTLGGTCVNVGCVPSKAMIRAVEPLHQARVASRFDGIEAQARITDWQALVEQKRALVDELRQAKYADLLLAHNRIAYLEGRAAFTPEGRLAVEGQPLDASRVIIATGARTAVPAIPGLASVDWLDSTSALELERLPGSLLVIGAGYIGAELAQLFARAGVAVTLVSRRGLLPAAEPEIGEALTACFRNEGIRCVSGIAYQRIERAPGGVRLTLTREGAPEVVEAEAVLLAAGRDPNVEGIGLGDAGIQTGDRGAILVDRHLRTSRPGVYAAGDVTGRDQFVYMAAYAAKLAARNALNGDSLAYDSTAMPAVVFTDPNAASVGLTEAEAGARKLSVRTATIRLDAVPRALAARDRRGLIKLVAEDDTGRLLGAHILAPEGADSIQTAAFAIRAGMTYRDVGEAIFPYLTTVEGLKLAAQTFDRDVATLSCCAG